LANFHYERGRGASYIKRRKERKVQGGDGRSSENLRSDLLVPERGVGDGGVRCSADGVESAIALL